MTKNVLGDDDSHVDHRSDGDCNARERHDVGIDAEPAHRDETHENGERKKPRDENGTSKVHDHDEHDDDRHEDLLRQCGFQRAEGLVNEFGSIVERNDRHLAGGSVRQRLLREAARDLLDLFLHGFDRGKGVLAVANHDDTADDFGAALVENAPTQRRP